MPCVTAALPSVSLQLLPSNVVFERQTTKSCVDDQSSVHNLIWITGSY